MTTQPTTPESMDAEPTTTEVLVVGGGPAGLAATIALGRLGVHTLLVERRATTSTHPRGHVENGRTMELFRLWGIEDQVRSAGLPRPFLRGVGFLTRLAGIELGSIRFSQDTEWLMGPDGNGPAALSSTPQDRLEPILLEAAEACPTVQTRFEWTVQDLTTTPDGVTAVLHGPDGSTQPVTASYAIACDGPRSSIRDALDIQVEGPGSLGAQLGIYFHADLSEFVDRNPQALYWLYNPEVQGVIISLDGHRRWHLLFAYDPDRESVEDYPPERCLALVHGLIGRTDVDVNIRSVLPWRMRADVATRFRSGRVFLAGDAAHTMPPTGGMGMNTGIGDVHNLAWKLHAVLRGTAGPGLLDTYEEERLPVGRRNTDNSVSNARTMVESGLAGIMVTDPAGFAAIEQPDGAAIRARMAEAIPGQFEHFAFDGLSFGYVYDSTAVVGDSTPPSTSTVGTYRPTAAPGARAPHLWLAQDGTPVSTVDLSDNQFVLLSADPTWVDAAHQTAADLDISLAAFHVHPDADPGLQDPTGQWSTVYGTGDRGAVLIRPDGHVAWRRPDAAGDPAAILRAVLTAVLHRN